MPCELGPVVGDRLVDADRQVPVLGQQLVSPAFLALEYMPPRDVRHEDLNRSYLAPAELMEIMDSRDCAVVLDLPGGEMYDGEQLRKLSRAEPQRRGTR